MKIERVLVLGCGVIGSSWASLFAANGLSVNFYDVDSASLLDGYQQALHNLQQLHDLGLLTEEQRRAAAQRLSIKSDLQAAAYDVQLVQESVVEDYAIKAQLYRQLEPCIVPATIIASSSSGLLISKMQAALEYPQRCLIAHPFNPPHIIPLVELVPGSQTSAGVLQQAEDFFEQLGKKTIRVNKEVPGHIANRLAAAVWRESLALLHDGVASAEDIDAALCHGPGLRWAIMGPHLTYELGGGEGGYEKFLQVFGSAFSSYWQDMATWTEVPEATKRSAIAGTQPYLQQKTSVQWRLWRDQKLISLLRVMDDA